MGRTGKVNVVPSVLGATVSAGTLTHELDTTDKRAQYKFTHSSKATVTIPFELAVPRGCNDIVEAFIYFQANAADATNQMVLTVYGSDGSTSATTALTTTVWGSVTADCSGITVAPYDDTPTTARGLPGVIFGSIEVTADAADTGTVSLPVFVFQRNVEFG